MLLKKFQNTYITLSLCVVSSKLETEREHEEIMICINVIQFQTNLFIPVLASL